jgi:hypothetical protein
VHQHVGRFSFVVPELIWVFKTQLVRSRQQPVNSPMCRCTKIQEAEA